MKVLAPHPSPTIATSWHAKCAALALIACGCDPYQPPPTSAPVTLCCGGHGACLPAQLVPNDQAQKLDSSECVAGALCVPDELQRARALKTCRQASTGAEGRCLPVCLPAVQQQLGLLAVDDCDQEQRCAPCYDPVSGAATGACAIGAGPGPLERPKLFEHCCDDIGRCVPRGLLSTDQRAGLSADRCSEADALCVPTAALTAGTAFVAPLCVVSPTGAEGRCLPACLPDVAARADVLARDGCADGYRCTPCYDPVTGDTTGACNQGADPGPKHPANIFNSCCQGVGRCVPSTLLSADQRTKLGADVCSGAEQLCAPLANLLDPKSVPDHCTVSSLNAGGACLPACLPDVARQSRHLAREGCREQYLCVPCFDPLTGKPTGSCSSTASSGEPVVFEPCCGGTSRCVPASFVSSDQQAQLGTDSCQGGKLCVSEEFIEDEHFTPARCKVAATGAEGRCLSECMPAVASRSAALAQDGCPPRQRCVPCYDPLTGEPTPACHLGSDAGPSQPPKVLSSCCDGLGRCTPRAWVPPQVVSDFGRDSCDADVLCVAPTGALLEPDSFVPKLCHDPSIGAEGRCLPPCLPMVAQHAAALRAGDCVAPSLCVPCFDPVSGASTRACKQGADPGPAEPARTFAPCCGSGSEALGLCVPSSLLPPDLPALPVDTCSTSGTVCAPRNLVMDPDAAAKSCTSLLVDKGICMESCFLSAAQNALTSAGSCVGNEHCVPCSAVGSSIKGC